MKKIEKQKIVQKIFLRNNESLLSLKCVLLLIMIIYFASVPFNNIYADQDDFYGTWMYSETDNYGRTFEIEIIISDNLYLEKIIIIKNDENKIISNLNVQMEIILWLESINTDISTKNEFPNGFILSLKKENGNIMNEAIYNSKDRNKMITNFLDDSEEQVIIFRRQ